MRVPVSHLRNGHVVVAVAAQLGSCCAVCGVRSGALACRNDAQLGGHEPLLPVGVQCHRARGALAGDERRGPQGEHAHARTLAGGNRPYRSAQVLRIFLLGDTPGYLPGCDYVQDVEEPVGMYVCAGVWVRVAAGTSYACAARRYHDDILFRVDRLMVEVRSRASHATWPCTHCLSNRRTRSASSSPSRCTTGERARRRQRQRSGPHQPSLCSWSLGCWRNDSYVDKYALPTSFNCAVDACENNAQV